MNVPLRYVAKAKGQHFYPLGLCGHSPCPHPELCARLAIIVCSRCGHCKDKIGYNRCYVEHGGDYWHLNCWKQTEVQL